MTKTYLSVRNSHPSNSGKQLPTLSQSKLIRVPTNWFSYLYMNVLMGMVKEI